MTSSVPVPLFIVTSLAYVRLFIMTSSVSGHRDVISICSSWHHQYMVICTLWRHHLFVCTSWRHQYLFVPNDAISICSSWRQQHLFVCPSWCHQYVHRDVYSSGDHAAFYQMETSVFSPAMKQLEHAAVHSPHLVLFLVSWTTLPQLRGLHSGEREDDWNMNSDSDN